MIGRGMIAPGMTVRATNARGMIVRATTGPARMAAAVVIAGGSATIVRATGMIGRGMTAARTPRVTTGPGMSAPWKSAPRTSAPRTSGLEKSAPGMSGLARMSANHVGNALIAGTGMNDRNANRFPSLRSKRGAAICCATPTAARAMHQPSCKPRRARLRRTLAPSTLRPSVGASPRWLMLAALTRADRAGQNL